MGSNYTFTFMNQPIWRAVHMGIDFQPAKLAACALKQAIVTPLIKKPSLAKDVLFKNYSSVSGLNFISKVFERIVANQLKSHLAANNLDHMN